MTAPTLGGCGSTPSGSRVSTRAVWSAHSGGHRLGLRTTVCPCWRGTVSEGTTDGSEASPVRAGPTPALAYHPYWRTETMPDGGETARRIILLGAAITSSGISASAYAREILIREPRTIRRWLAGGSP